MKSNETGKIEVKREQLKEKANTPVEVHGHPMTKATVIKQVGLVAFLVIIVAICVALWPTISDLFQEGGVNRLVETVQNAGPLGVLMLLGMQLLQIIVAFIPGEVVQIAAGMMYGPFWGAVIILVGCAISSTIIYYLVHQLGAPFVQAMVPTKWLDKFREFEKSGRLAVVVFILFLIPALPKDTFTYLVPLTDMKVKLFVALTTIARIPGVLISTLAASGLAEGDYLMSGILFGVAAVMAIAAIVFRKPLMNLLDRFQK